MTEPRHAPGSGNTGSYKRGCRCDECRAANRESGRRARARYGRCAQCGGKVDGSGGPLATPHLCVTCYRVAIAPPHGTNSRYGSSKWRCRCTDCRRAHAKYQVAWYHRKVAA